MELHALSARQMIDGLKKREISPLELLEAHERRIDAVDGKTRAIVHRLRDEARAAAKDSTQRLARGEGRPLEGLPITIKESISTKGLPVTLGVKARQSKPPAERDAAIVTALRELGAIPFAKTNVSQLLLFHESDNPIWGATNNPWSTDRVPGGSSGGEAAAIAAGLSPAGIGTDIGGSIRVPAAFCGIAGLKPTIDRWPSRGIVGALAGQEIVRGMCGPMARSADDVAMIWGAMDPARLAALDPAVPPLAFGDPRRVDIAKLRIGYTIDDGFLAPASSVARAVDEAKRALESLGATLVPYVPPHLDRVLETYFSALSSDGGDTIGAHLAGDPIAKQLAGLLSVARMPGPIRKAAAVVMAARGEHRVATILRNVHARSVAELWRVTADRTDLRLRTADAWDEHRLDAIITPPHSTPALRHGDSVDFTLGGLESLLYNFLNLPAGVVPFTRVRASDVPRATPRDRIERRAAAVEAGSEGLPIGVQVVARTWREDVVLAVMLAIEAKARAGADFPETPIDPQ